jgi:hypothetical protein
MKNEIVKVNDVQIECPYVNDQHFVAVKSICEALGIDTQKQQNRIKSDRKLSQLYTDTVYSSGADGKQRSMFCIPLKYVFGWLFSIDESKVKESARTDFMKYKDACYDALYEKFFIEGQFIKLKTEEENKVLIEISELESQVESKKAEIKAAKTKLQTIKDFTYDDYKRNKNG